ncbi:MAG: hypothetical protein ACUVQ4_01200 [bacterium]
MVINILSLIIFTLTIKSANGAYIGDVTYTGGTDLLTASFKLYNQEGHLLYQIIHPDAITFFISNSGEVFATNEQHLYLYTQNGTVAQLRNLQYPNGFGFSPDNTLFFASDRNGIYAYSMQGKIVYQFSPGRIFASTTQGKRMAIISTDTLFYYQHGELKFQKIISSPFVRKIYFSPDEKTLHLELPDSTILIKISDFFDAEE